MKHPLLIALPCYALDQVTKWWVVRHIEFEYARHSVIPGFFDLVYWGNTGAAFGSFKDNNWFFISLSAITFVGLLIAWQRGVFREPANRWGVGLLMGGILGNVTDRFVHHHVVDFLLFDLHVRFANPWPAFNVADSCILSLWRCFYSRPFFSRASATRRERRTRSVGASPMEVPAAPRRVCSGSGGFGEAPRALPIGGGADATAHLTRGLAACLRASYTHAR